MLTAACFYVVRARRYHNLPPQQSRAWAAAGYSPALTAAGAVLSLEGSSSNSSSGNGPPPPWCQLYGGGADPSSYLQLQCVEGYTGERASDRASEQVTYLLLCCNSLHATSRTLLWRFSELASGTRM